MPAVGAALAGGEAAGQTASGRGRQITACRGRTRTPSAHPFFATTAEPACDWGGAWSRSKNFFADFHVRPAGVPSAGFEVGPQPGTLLLPRLPSGRSPGRGSRTQVEVPWHFPRPPR